MKILLAFLKKFGKYIGLLILIGIVIYGLYLTFSGRELQFQVLPQLYN